MTLETVCVCEKSQIYKTNIVWLYLHEISRIGKFTEAENRTDSRGPGVGWEMGSCCLMSSKFYSGVKKIFWKQTVTMTASSEHCHWTIHLKIAKMANATLYGFYHNKTITLQSSLPSPLLPSLTGLVAIPLLHGLKAFPSSFSSLFSQTPHPIHQLILSTQPCRCI